MTNGIDHDALAREMKDWTAVSGGTTISISNAVWIAMRYIQAARAEALEEAALKCDALTKFGDAFPSNGNSKAWARAPNPRPHGAASMTDRDALAREMLEAWKIDSGLPNEKAADIALRHIQAARAEGYKAGWNDREADFMERASSMGLEGK